MTEICENNKIHYFYREMDFRKTEWPSLTSILQLQMFTCQYLFKTIAEWLSESIRESDRLSLRIYYHGKDINKNHRNLNNSFNSSRSPSWSPF